MSLFNKVTKSFQWGDKTVDFTPPFARKTYDEVIAEHVKIDPTDQAARGHRGLRHPVLVAARRP